MSLRLAAVLLAVIVAVSGTTTIPTFAAPWPEQAAREAKQGGYSLVDTAELARILENGRKPLLLDVRPDYEFREGHIEGAINVEFDLGDDRHAAPAKLDRIRRLAGPDTSRPIVIYCRSLQCIRSAIAAREVANMGYGNVLRYPLGWFGWVAAHPALQSEGIDPIKAGDVFPGCPIWPIEAEAQEYLGLENLDRAFLEAVRADYLLVQFFNSECPACLEGMKAVEQYWNRVQAEPTMRQRLRFVGIASHDCLHDARAFSRRVGIPFPVFTDPDGSVLQRTGYQSLPVTFLLRRGEQGRWVVMLIKDGLGGANRFYRDMRSSVTSGY
jgi:rhodanese-related sulfurtransferase